MGILKTIASIISPIVKIIDDVFTSKEEKQNARNVLKKIELDLITEHLNYQTELLKSKANIITAESNGKSWLQRNWRPITMLTFLVLVVADTMGLTKFRLSEEAWTLLQIGLGGYVIGRSVEKIMPKNGINSIKEAIIPSKK